MTFYLLVNAEKSQFKHKAYIYLNDLQFNKLKCGFLNCIFGQNVILQTAIQ